MPASHLLQLFTAWQHGRGFSAATVKRRAAALQSFQNWCRPMSIAEAAFTDVEEWLATFATPRTRHAYRSDLNVFYRWGLKRQVIYDNPVALTDSVRVPKGLPKPINPESVPLIIAVATDSRLKLACALAAYAGLRVSEIVALDVADVSLRVSRLDVRDGKGHKDRSVLIIPPLAAVLAQHAPRAGRVVPWNPHQCGQRVAHHLRRLGIDATAHSLRHTAATEAARHADLRTVADFLGHASVVTTEGYAALTRDWGPLSNMYGTASSN